MPNDPASLQNLHDIVVPAPPPPWPPALGVWVLLGVVLAVVTALVVLWLRARSRNAYRRAGLALLASARTSRDVDIVLKRVALAAWPRPEVAPLYGAEWAAFLDRSCRGTSFSAIPAVECGGEVSDELRRLARTWIRAHRVPARTASAR